MSARSSGALVPGGVLLLLSGAACSSTATVGQLAPVDAAIVAVPALDAGVLEPRPPDGPEAAALDAASEDDASAADAERDAEPAEASSGCTRDEECPAGRLCAGGVCVQCISDQQCLLAEEPRCDRRGRCVECTSSEQCTTGRVCAPWGECEFSCTRDTQCLGALRCDALAGVCLECMADDDCAGRGEFCDEGVCRPCAFDTDCPN